MATQSNGKFVCGSDEDWCFSCVAILCCFFVQGDQRFRTSPSCLPQWYAMRCSGRNLAGDGARRPGGQVSPLVRLASGHV